MNYNELKEKAHSNAVNHGFWKHRLSNEHCLMLVIAEIGELVEADRNSKMADIKVYKKGIESSDEIAKTYRHDTDIYRISRPNVVFERHIKDTVEDEFADIAIRLFDLAGALGVDFDKMQPCRYYRAYNKFSFTENAFALCKGLSRDVIGIEKRIQFGLRYVEDWAKTLGIDLYWHIKQKMKYNENRPSMHNKKY